MEHLVAIDAGTTGVRSALLNETGDIVDVSYRELSQHFPAPGYVEHDAHEIWTLVATTLEELLGRARDERRSISAIGITNQRETVVAWDRATGEVLAPALVWQDKRTASRCAELRAQGHLDRVREITGLVLDPYFSATKMAWLIESQALAGAHSPVLGTVDSWVVWNLTGATSGGVVRTDPSNASRTLLYDLSSLTWSEEMCELFGVPEGTLPAITPSCGRVGVVASTDTPLARGLAISGILGDQQAALFGQACFEPGMIKATYGTGAFVLVHAGTTPPVPPDGLLTSVAWDLGAHGDTSYALEGSAFVAGAAIQWLRDELGIIDTASEIETLALQADPAHGLAFVPAFVGLGSPWWDESARGAMVGITRGTGRHALARAVVDSLAFEVRAITDAMSNATDTAVTTLRADGGAAIMDLLLQSQADQSQLRVARATSLESTARGAASIAGLAEGVFGSLDELGDHWTLDVAFDPALSPEVANVSYTSWLAAVERSRGWITTPSSTALS